jgi:hypothetical protein
MCFRVLLTQSPAPVLNTLLEHPPVHHRGEQRKSPLLKAGDFDVSRYTELLVELMKAMDFRPVYSPEDSPEATHHYGEVLDWEFMRGISQPPLCLMIKAKDQDHAILKHHIGPTASPRATQH